MIVPRSFRKRRVMDNAVRVVAGLAAALGIFVMGWILLEVIMRGARSVDWDTFTKLPTPAGVPGGGFASAIVGSLMMTVLAAVMGIPVGLFAGVYLAEFGRNSKSAAAVRFVSNVLMGTPSIIIGVFVYTIVVLETGGFSGYAGAIALALIMLPLMARTAEDMLLLVPNEIRESALALGAPRWKATVGVVFRAAKNGLLTGGLLAIARVSGETAPLLFTSLNNKFWNLTLKGPTASLTVTTYSYASSPYADWQEKAWAASLLIIAAVLAMTVSARFLLQERRK
jgi:phosphate transport system permease protein